LTSNNLYCADDHDHPHGKKQEGCKAKNHGKSNFRGRKKGKKTARITVVIRPEWVKGFLEQA